MNGLASSRTELAGSSDAGKMISATGITQTAVQTSSGSGTKITPHQFPASAAVIATFQGGTTLSTEIHAIMQDPTFAEHETT